MSRKSWQISRRTMLRGAGAALALPLLDAMRPLQAMANSPAGPSHPVRMAFLAMPNGVNPHHWTPKGAGREFEFSKTLAPLAPLKDNVLVVSELTNEATHTGDGHYVKSAAWLTGTTITRTTGADIRSGGISVDQLAAQHIGNLTPLPSLELGIEPVNTGVDANVGYTRLYGSHISWSTPTTPVAKEINPKFAFDRLFRSDAGSKFDTRDNSVLDIVKEDAAALKQRVGKADQLKLEEYLDAVRAVEKRIEFDARNRRQQYLDDRLARAEIEKLGGRINDIYTDGGRVRDGGIDHSTHVRLMLDIITLAFWTDSTRISTFMFGNAVSGRNFSFLDGVNGGHHQISHHENKEDKLEEYRIINQWHVEQYAYLLNRLGSIREGEGTLLDNCMIMFGSGLRDGNSHNPHNLPILVGGRGGGTIATGRHLVYESKTPLCNLYVSMLNRVGIATDRFADATGPLAGLDDPNFAGVPANKG